jgi:hypothetical protein
MKRRRVKHFKGAPLLSYFTKEETRQAVGVLQKGDGFSCLPQTVTACCLLVCMRICM